MKKEYKRPVIQIEEFTLAAHIASCGGGANAGNGMGHPLHNKGQCAWEDPFGDRIFNSGINACQEICDGDDYNGLCYNTPTSAARIFAS